MVEFGACLSFFPLCWYFGVTGVAEFAYLLYD